MHVKRSYTKTELMQPMGGRSAQLTNELETCSRLRSLTYNAFSCFAYLSQPSKCIIWSGMSSSPSSSEREMPQMVFSPNCMPTLILSLRGHNRTCTQRPSQQNRAGIGHTSVNVTMVLIASMSTLARREHKGPLYVMMMDTASRKAKTPMAAPSPGARSTTENRLNPE